MYLYMNILLFRTIYDTCTWKFCCLELSMYLYMNIFLFRTIYVPVENAINVPSSFDINVGTTLGKSKVKKIYLNLRKIYLKSNQFPQRRILKRNWLLNPNFLATWCCRPLMFQTFTIWAIIFLSFEYTKCSISGCKNKKICGK